MALWAERHLTGVRLQANQELIGQGIGNIVIPFFGGVPATAAIARTSVGIKSGGQTRMVSVVHSAGLLFWSSDQAIVEAERQGCPLCAAEQNSGPVPGIEARPATG